MNRKIQEDIYDHKNWLNIRVYIHVNIYYWNLHSGRIFKCAADVLAGKADRGLAIEQNSAQIPEADPWN